MIRCLIALLTLIAVTLNAPMALAGIDPAAQQVMTTMAADGAMHDCGAPAKDQPCHNAVCVVCHAIPFEAPKLFGRAVAFLALAPAPARALTGLNPEPEPRPPRG
jgi:cytochrome c553